jgi:hypothetical protein
MYDKFIDKDGNKRGEENVIVRDTFRPDTEGYAIITPTVKKVVQIHFNC